MKLEIRLLGPPAILLDGALLIFSRRKTEALLYYLAGRGADIASSSAADLLWPEFEPQRAKASLRRALCDSTAVAGRRLVERRGRSIGFSGELEIGCDATDFALLAERGLAEGDEVALSGAAALYRGEYLEGFYLDDALLFEDWQLLEAQHFKTRASEVFQRLARLEIDSGRLDEAEEWARRLAKTDPLAGSGHRLLMEIAAARGDAPEAIERYEVYATILERELGARPDPSLEAFKNSLAAGGEPGRKRRGPAGEDREAGPLEAAQREAAPREAALKEAKIGSWIIDTTVSPAGFRAARDHFSSALERRPDQPEALLGLAICAFGGIFLGLAPPSAFPQALDPVRRGRELHPRHAGLLAFEAFLRCVWSWEWEAAAELFEKAWQAGAEDPGVANWYANFLCTIGRFDESLEVAEAAQSRSPSSCITAFSVALRLHYLGRHGEALEACERLLSSRPEYWLAHQAKGWCELALGSPGPAAESFRRALPDGGYQARVYRSCALARLGRPDEARRELGLAEAATARNGASRPSSGASPSPTSARPKRPGGPSTSRSMQGTSAYPSSTASPSAGPSPPGGRRRA